MKRKPNFKYGDKVCIKTDMKQEYIITAIIDRGSTYYYECTNHETILTMQEVMIAQFDGGKGFAGFVQNLISKPKK